MYAKYATSYFWIRSRDVFRGSFFEIACSNVHCYMILYGVCMLPRASCLKFHFVVSDRPGNLGLFGALLQPHAPENVFWQIFCENACTRARYYVVFPSFSRIRPTRTVDHRGMGGTEEASTHVRAIVLYRQALIVKHKKAARDFRFSHLCRIYY